MLPASSLIIPPFLVAAIAGWLGHDNFPKWLNTIISFIVISLVAIIWSLFSGKLVGNDIWTNIIFVAGVCAAFVAGALARLQKWFTAKTTSPLIAITAMFPWRHIATTQPMPPVASRSSSHYYQGSSITPRRTMPYTYADPYANKEAADRHDTSAVIPAMPSSTPAAPTSDDPSATTTTSDEEPPAA